GRVAAVVVIERGSELLARGLLEAETDVFRGSLRDVVVDAANRLVRAAGVEFGALGLLPALARLLSGGERVVRAEEVVDGQGGPDDDRGQHQQRTDDLAAEADQPPRRFAPAGRSVLRLLGVRRYDLARGGGLHLPRRGALHLPGRGGLQLPGGGGLRLLPGRWYQPGFLGALKLLEALELLELLEQAQLLRVQLHVGVLRGIRSR